MDADAPAPIMEELKKNDVFRLLFLGGRFATFQGKKWIFDKKSKAVCTSENLAKAGFIYVSKTSTMCPFCAKTLEWEDASEDPFQEHRDHCPTCDFLPLLEKDESEWTLNDAINLMAALAAQHKIKQCMGWKQQCESLYYKIDGRLAPYCPNVKEEAEDSGGDDQMEQD